MDESTCHSSLATRVWSPEPTVKDENCLPNIALWSPHNHCSMHVPVLHTSCTRTITKEPLLIIAWPGPVFINAAWWSDGWTDWQIEEQIQNLSRRLNLLVYVVVDRFQWRTNISNWSVGRLCVCVCVCETTDTPEIQRIVRNYFENLYSNNLENLVEKGKFLRVYDMPQLD